MSLSVSLSLCLGLCLSLSPSLSVCLSLLVLVVVVLVLVLQWGVSLTRPVLVLVRSLSYTPHAAFSGPCWEL